MREKRIRQTISVCITTYNGEKYIQQQLSSILSQLGADDEVIVSDDGSSDHTLEMIEAFRSPLVHIYRNNGEHGYTSNFENALRHATGELIFLADQDDIWKAQKVETCRQALQTCSLVISDAELIDGNGNPIAPSFYALRKSAPGFLHTLYRFSYLGCCIAFRREILSKALPFPKNHRLCTHDNWLTLVGMAFYKTKVLDDKLICYRRHGNNTSAGGFGKTSLLFKISYRLYLLFWLIRRAMK